MKNFNKILLALLAGAAAGSTLALLYAPGRGKDTRRKISDTAQDLSDKIIKKAEEMINNAEDTLQKGKSYMKQQL